MAEEGLDDRSYGGSGDLFTLAVGGAEPNFQLLRSLA